MLYIVVILSLFLIYISINHYDSFLQREYRKYVVSVTEPWALRAFLNDDNTTKYGKLSNI